MPDRVDSEVAKVKSTEQLLELARRSCLVEEGRFSDFVATIDSQSESAPQTVDEMADRLIDAKLLNRWQVNNLLKGKYKGFTLGKYKLLGHLGTGGMSSVYLAEHPVMERLVGIKVLPKRYLEDTNYLDRFRREARAVASLDHRNIVRAFDIDQDGDTHYIVMEYVDGRDLQKTVKEDGPLHSHDAVDYIAQAALGLQHAHDAGLIHRDVKPANCLLDKNGCVKLLDLGLAMFSQDDRESLSEKYKDSVVGTADYLAPEQARNSQTVDSRADIYGLGCTLYFLLTGQPPFPDGSIAERLLKHQTDEPQSLFDLKPATAPFVVDLCRRMMIKSRDQRIQTCREVAGEIRVWLASQGKSIRFDQLAGGDNTVSGDSNPGGESRWSRSSSGRGSNHPGRSGSGIGRSDTVHSSVGDTARMSTDSSLNENLQLAPIDETDGKNASTSSSGLHDDKRSRSGGNASDVIDSSDSKIDEKELERYGSGPLDALLGDKKFHKSVKLPKAQLSSAEPKSFSAWIWIGVGIALAILGGLIAVMVAT